MLFRSLLTLLVDQSNESRRYRTLVTVIDHPSLKGLRLDGQRHDTGEDADRRAYDIAASKQILIPDVQAPGLLVMVHELPAGKGVQSTALNFSAETISETVTLPGVAPGPVVDIIHESIEGDLTENGEMTFNLAPYGGLALRVVSAASPVL